jgi:hypothetical protein
MKRSHPEYIQGLHEEISKYHKKKDESRFKKLYKQPKGQNVVDNPVQITVMYDETKNDN